LLKTTETSSCSCLKPTTPSVPFCSFFERAFKTAPNFGKNTFNNNK